MADIIQYKCPYCSAPLVFNPNSQMVHCDSCGNDFTIDAVKEFTGTAGQSEEFDWGEYRWSQALGERLENVKVYQCESCGALVEADENTVATTCPYCDNNLVLSDRVSNSLRPNAIIPFEIDNKQLWNIIRDFYKDKPFLPKNFFTENQIERAQGVYVPFWMFTSKLDGTVTMNATRIDTHREGKYEVTNTHHFLLKREGSMVFELVPEDASKGMDNDLMDSIQPYDYSKMVDFDSAYLTGFLADKFDSEPENEIERAKQRMMNSAYDVMKSTCGPYAFESLRSNGMRAYNTDVKYVFLPVYILNCTYQGKKYRYAINGQSGKIVGELPISKGRVMRYFLRTFALVGLGIAAALMLL